MKANAYFLGARFRFWWMLAAALGFYFGFRA
jgi:hypothetical protein